MTGLGAYLLNYDNPMLYGAVGAVISEVISVLGAYGLDHNHKKQIKKLTENGVKIVGRPESKDMVIIFDAIKGTNLTDKVIGSPELIFE